MKCTNILLLLMITLCSAIVTEHYMTDSRYVYGYWNICDNCTCEYVYVYAYEQDTRTVGKTAGSVDPYYYLYMYYYNYNYCDNTWFYSYTTSQEPITGLWISQSGRSATLNLVNMTDNFGNNVNTSLSWIDIGITNGCNCRNTDNSGPYSYKSNSRSNYFQSEVNGNIFVGDRLFSFEGLIGYIYLYGSKTIIMTHA